MVGAANVTVLPVPIAVFPQLTVNQLIEVPVPEEALRLILPPVFEQKLFISEDKETGAVGKGNTVIVILRHDETPQIFSHLT